MSQGVRMTGDIMEPFGNESGERVNDLRDEDKG